MSAPAHQNPVATLKKGIPLLFRALPEKTKPKFWFSVVTTVLLPVFDLAVAYWLFVMLILLQGDTLTLLGKTLNRGNLGLVVVAFMASTLLRQVVEYLSIRISRGFTQEIFQNFSVQLFKKYLSLPWLAFTQETKAIRIKHCTVTALDSAYSYQVVLNLIGSSFSMVFLGMATVLKAPALALGASVLLSFFSWISKKYVKGRLQNAVAAHEFYQKRFYQKLHESLSLPREIKIFQAFPFFHQEVQKELADLSKAKIDLSVLPQVPRITLELILTLAIALGILAITFSGNYNSKELIANVATIAILARRIIPSMAVFISSFTEIDGAIMNVLLIDQEIHTETPTQPSYAIKNLPASTLLQLRNISFGYLPEKSILNQVSLDVQQGDRIALLGETGKGKSTLIMIAAGFITPTAGQVIRSQELERHKSAMAYVPQEVTLLSGSILDNIIFGDDLIDEQLAQEVAAIAQLDKIVSGLPEGIHTPVGDNGVLFSGGQRQRMGLARALYKQPLLLFLDEATSALDEKTEREVMKSIDSFMGKGAVVFITHRELAAEAFATKLHRL